MPDHLVDGDGQGALIAQLRHADGVADEDDVHALRFLGEARGREVVGGEHGDAIAALFAPPEVEGRDAGLGLGCLITGRRGDSSVSGRPVSGPSGDRPAARCR